MLTVNERSHVTIREFIQQCLATVHDLDKPMMIRLRKRDEEGSVTHLKAIPIAGVHFQSDYITVENADWEQAEWTHISEAQEW